MNWQQVTKRRDSWSEKETLSPERTARGKQSPCKQRHAAQQESSATRGSKCAIDVSAQQQRQGTEQREAKRGRELHAPVLDPVHAEDFVALVQTQTLEPL